ncbi:MAG: hypothetical protein ACTSV2_14650 [Candidatus Thorarchaeota archaeon]
MTFLIDPPLLILFSIISLKIGDLLRTKTKIPVGKILVVFSLVVILFTSTSLYLNGWWLDWFWIPFQPGVTSGRDLMINSGIFSFESVNTAGLIDALAFIQIALYPLWSYLGIKVYERFLSKSSD